MHRQKTIYRKRYLLNEFFKTGEDTYYLTEGEIDEHDGKIYNGVIEGYSGARRATVKFSTNHKGNIVGISFHFDNITSVDVYLGIIKIFVSKNAGKSIVLNKNENIRQEFTLVKSFDRLDTMLVRGNLGSAINSYGKLTKFSNCFLNILFTSTES